MRNDLAPLFRADGPFVSVYLDARSDQPQAQQHLAARWKSVRATLAGEGAGEDDLDAADGAARTVEMLQAATVETLLVHDDPGDDRMAWIGPQPVHLALEEATVRDMGVEAPSAIVRDGLGAVLRHTGTAPGAPRS